MNRVICCIAFVLMVSCARAPQKALWECVEMDIDSTRTVNDSIARFAYNYYSRHGSKRNRMMATYMGFSCQRLSYRPSRCSCTSWRLAGYSPSVWCKRPACAFSQIIIEIKYKKVKLFLVIARLALLNSSLPNGYGEKMKDISSLTMRLLHVTENLSLNYQKQNVIFAQVKYYRQWQNWKSSRTIIPINTPQRLWRFGKFYSYPFSSVFFRLARKTSLGTTKRCTYRRLEEKSSCLEMSLSKTYLF